MYEIGVEVYGLQGCFCDIDRWIWGVGLWIWVKLGFRVCRIPSLFECIRVLCEGLLSRVRNGPEFANVKLGLECSHC